MARDTGSNASETRAESAAEADLNADAALLARWGAACALLSLLGLFMAARAGDDYYYVSGLAFTAFGLFLGTRLLARWRP